MMVDTTSEPVLKKSFGTALTGIRNKILVVAVFCFLSTLQIKLNQALSLLVVLST